MNLYFHFPFCRAKCTYCALLSRAGSTPETRRAHVSRLCREIAALPPPPAEFHTLYFGGGSPALCELAPLFTALGDKGFLNGECEFTVELHPHDATPAKIDELLAGGVNRVSLGVQSFDDATLRLLNRRHTADEAREALARLAVFPAVGLDLIAGLPHPAGTPPPPPDFAAFPHLVHASVYTLIREPHTLLDRAAAQGRLTLPDDDAALAEAAILRDALRACGLERYEISNCARPGCECRHNFAVWRGEDYLGFGEGACGRQGLRRTRGTRDGYEEETLSAESDALERALFALRTSDGFSPARACTRWPVLAPRLSGWREALARACDGGFVTEEEDVFRLTPRGAEVCDALLADLV